MNQVAEKTVRNIAHRWDGTDRSILGHVIRLLLSGTPLPVSTLSVVTGSSPFEVERQLELAGADRNEAGDVTGLGGISVVGGPFHIQAPGIHVHSCCALTAHAVAIISGESIEIDTFDPVDESPIRISAIRSGVLSMSPMSSIATFVSLDTPQMKEGLSARFCRYARYFRSQETVDQFDFGDLERLTLSSQEIHEAADLWAKVVWGIGLMVGNGK